MAIALDGAGRQNEALAAHDRARELLGAMGDANPTLLSVTRDRAWIDTSNRRNPDANLAGMPRPCRCSSGPGRPGRPW